MTQPLLSVNNLSKTFKTGLFGKGFKALDNVTLEVGPGSVFGLLGPNGAGKTTLIKVLLGLCRGWEGDAKIFGERAGHAPPRQRIGYLPEAHRLPGYLTGRQALMLYGRYAGRSGPWLKERVQGWIERVGMAHAADRKVREYSKGMQQRIGLAQALLHDPELIFLDEPTDGIDPIGRAEIRRIVSELRDDGVTIFINSHLLLEVEQICDHVVIMSRGKILREGTMEELTPRTGRTEFGIEAGGKDLSAILAGVGANLTPTELGFTLDLDSDEQNHAIDRLRSNGIPIRSIAPGKMTLEEVFVDLVKGGKQ